MESLLTKSRHEPALKVLILVVVAFSAGLAVHWRDDAQESRDVRAIVAKYDDLGQSNLLAAYIGNAAISKAIRSGKPGSAQCEADLRASFQYDELKACLADPKCAAGIVDVARAEAPELLKDGPLPFRHYKAGEACAPDGKPSGG